MKKWTSEEIEILENNYVTLSRKDLYEALPDRTWRAIKLKAFRLKLSYQCGTPEERFWKYVDKKQDNECWNWTAYCHKSGYGKINIKDKIVSAHRFSWVLHNGTIPNDKPLVLHDCDNPKCVNPSHLFLGTHKDNSDDKVKKNRQSRICGEDHRNSKLTENQIKEIRTLCAKREFTQKKIGKMFNINHRTVSYIHRNKTWKHVH